MKHNERAVEQMARLLWHTDDTPGWVWDAYRDKYNRQAVTVLDVMVPPGMTIDDLLISGQESAENAIRRIAQVGHRGISILNGTANLTLGDTRREEE